MEIIKEINENSGAITAIFTAILTLITGWYAIITRKMLKANEDKNYLDFAINTIYRTIDFESEILNSTRIIINKSKSKRIATINNILNRHIIQDKKSKLVDTPTRIFDFDNNTILEKYFKLWLMNNSNDVYNILFRINHSMVSIKQILYKIKSIDKKVFEDLFYIYSSNNHDQFKDFIQFLLSYLESESGQKNSSENESDYKIVRIQIEDYFKIQDEFNHLFSLGNKKQDWVDILFFRFNPLYK